MSVWMQGLPYELHYITLMLKCQLLVDFEIGVGLLLGKVAKCRRTIRATWCQIKMKPASTGCWNSNNIENTDNTKPPRIHFNLFIRIIYIMSFSNTSSIRSSTSLAGCGVGHSLIDLYQTDHLTGRLQVWKH